MEIRKRARLFILTTTLIAFHSTAKEIDIGVTASSELTFSDNIRLSSDNENSGLVSIWSAGAFADFQGGRGNLLFKYDVSQTFHTIDSDRNELFNELEFKLDNYIYRNNINFNAEASITNISRSIENNPNEDIISGNTIETRALDVALSYKSNPRGIVDFYGIIGSGVTSNEDNIGDFYNIGTDILIRNGSSVKSILWLTDYTFNHNISRANGDEYFDYTFEQEVGLQPIKNISPLVRLYYEGYTESASDRFIESGSWGPILRYYWSERSYVELGYDFSFYDEDFWRGAFRLNPTPRTLVEFDYTRRFFGDSYLFSLSHKNKRLTNSIEYNEGLVGFDREFLVIGENIEQYELVRELSLDSTLELKRTSFSFEINLQDRRPVTDIEDLENKNIYGTKVSASHQLSRDTSVSAGFKYDKNVFNTTSKNNYYRMYDLSLTNQFSRSLSWDLSFDHKNGSSYRENRVNFIVDLVY